MTERGSEEDELTRMTCKESVVASPRHDKGGNRKVGRGSERVLGATVGGPAAVVSVVVVIKSPPGKEQSVSFTFSDAGDAGSASAPKIASWSDSKMSKGIVI